MSIKAQNSVDMMYLLQLYGYCLSLSVQFKNKEAISHLERLPDKHSLTGWTLNKIADCFMELQEFTKAEQIFKKMMRFEPYRIEGLDNYSICLWRLKKVIELCQLSNHILGKNLFAPETWIIVGNCYSAQNEHDAAIKFFKRAIQINPRYSLAFALCGHEFVQIEDTKAAKNYYERGLSVDNDKNYKILWGLGNIYMKQEKYGDAKRYFESAKRLNPFSSSIHTYLGLTYKHLDDHQRALREFLEAERLNPSHMHNKFHRAITLMQLDQRKDAMDLLKQLLRECPKEPQVHIQLGKLLKKENNKREALKHFNIALDLDSKDSNTVKCLIENLNSENEFGEEEQI